MYHSTLNEVPDVQVACGIGMLPIKTTTRGPAPLAPEGAVPCSFFFPSSSLAPLCVCATYVVNALPLLCIPALELTCLRATVRR